MLRIEGGTREASPGSQLRLPPTVLVALKDAVESPGNQPVTLAKVSGVDSASLGEFQLRPQWVGSLSAVAVDES
jgi:hypothetical protein